MRQSCNFVQGVRVCKLENQYVYQPLHLRLTFGGHLQSLSNVKFDDSNKCSNRKFATTGNMLIGSFEKKKKKLQISSYSLGRKNEFE